jgi:predicted esterase
MKRLTRLFARVLVVGSTVHPAASAAQWENVKLADSPRVIEPHVSYLSREPVIDGVLDADLGKLPVRRFTMVGRSASDNPDYSPGYRLAYGTRFLYVFVEIDAEELVYRDRAYQNGDGFTLVLARPRPGNEPTPEFYVLACSAVDRPSMEWSRRVFWYYNVDHIFLPTSEDVQMKFTDGKGRIGFELLLPWKDVHPYHPWLCDEIGFNLGLVKAVGEQERNSYRVVDAGIGDENSPRDVALLRFEPPRHRGDAQTFLLLNRNTITAGDTLGARSVTVASESCTERLRITVQAGEKTAVDNATATVACTPGLTFADLTIGVRQQPAGGYVVKWRSLSNESRGESGLSVLPAFDAAAWKKKLDGVKKALSPGSYETLGFMIEEIDGGLRKLYPYETAASQRIGLSRLGDYIQAAEGGDDAFARQRGFVRMAYRSELDGTFQPYVVRIPDDFDPKKKYPLLVYLHGSASTERDIAGVSTIPDGFIALGPRGRGPSNWYSWDDAQADIAEAVRSVKRNFPIDADNVFLSGFSMGGYGVYRTFYEAPGTYRAIAIFSGTPRVTFDVPEGVEVIDFNQERFLDRFKGMPVFVFHGKRDLNVSYEETEQFVARLERSGARVEFHAEEDKGHESPGEKTIEAYFRWVRAQLRQ